MNRCPGIRSCSRGQFPSLTTASTFWSATVRPAGPIKSFSHRFESKNAFTMNSPIAVLQPVLLLDVSHRFYWLKFFNFFCNEIAPHTFVVNYYISTGLLLIAYKPWMLRAEIKRALDTLNKDGMVYFSMHFSDLLASLERSKNCWPLFWNYNPVS